MIWTMLVEILITIPVSYTHLDVYKRQEFPLPINFDNEIDQIASLKPEQWKPHFEFQAQCFYDDSIEKEREESVSYTHLDVYKRQAFWFGSFMVFK